MALDAATLELTAQELKTVLTDAKIAKLFEPTRDELVITLRTRTDTYALLLSARSGSARVCLTEETSENPALLLHADAQAPHWRQAAGCAHGAGGPHRLL